MLLTVIRNLIFLIVAIGTSISRAEFHAHVEVIEAKSDFVQYVSDSRIQLLDYVWSRPPKLVIVAKAGTVVSKKIHEFGWDFKNHNVSRRHTSNPGKFSTDHSGGLKIHDRVVSVAFGHSEVAPADSLRVS